MTVKLKMYLRRQSGLVSLHRSQCQYPSVVCVALGRPLQGSSCFEQAVYHGPPSLSFLMKLIVARKVSQSGCSPCPSCSVRMEATVLRSWKGTTRPPPGPLFDMDTTFWPELPPWLHQEARRWASGCRGFLVMLVPEMEPTLRPPKSETRAPLTATIGVLAKSVSALLALSPQTVKRTSALESSTRVISHLKSSWPDFLEITVPTGDTWRA
mmetsp:Transcript_18872/g.43021  ORF Transcript_18872/g.43021 Transcript_18872/m.43021 type:complete len:211 (+) Transcript_18872:454-1086(+)